MQQRIEMLEQEHVKKYNSAVDEAKVSPGGAFTGMN